MSLRTDLPRALRSAWLILTFIALAAIVAPLVVPYEVLYGLFPECEARARGDACPFCGMTTAFISLSRGDIAAARESNAGSLAVYGAILVNFAAAAAYSIMTLLRRRGET
jgi:hypothetical protein